MTQEPLPRPHASAVGRTCHPGGPHLRADPKQSQRFGVIHKHLESVPLLLSLRFLFVYSFIHFKFQAAAELEGVREARRRRRRPFFPPHVSDLSEQHAGPARCWSGGGSRKHVPGSGWWAGHCGFYANASWQRRLFPSVTRAQTHSRRARTRTHVDRCRLFAFVSSQARSCSKTSR